MVWQHQLTFFFFPLFFICHSCEQVQQQVLHRLQRQKKNPSGDSSRAAPMSGQHRRRRERACPSPRHCWTPFKVSTLGMHCKISKMICKKHLKVSIKRTRNGLNQASNVTIIKEFVYTKGPISASLGDQYFKTAQICLLLML